MTTSAANVTRAHVGGRIRGPESRWNWARAPTLCGDTWDSSLLRWMVCKQDLQTGPKPKGKRLLLFFLTRFPRYLFSSCLPAVLPTAALPVWHPVPECSGWPAGSDPSSGTVIKLSAEIQAPRDGPLLCSDQGQRSRHIPRPTNVRWQWIASLKTTLPVFTMPSF